MEANTWQALSAMYLTERNGFGLNELLGQWCPRTQLFDKLLAGTRLRSLSALQVIGAFGGKRQVVLGCCNTEDG